MSAIQIEAIPTRPLSSLAPGTPMTEKVVVTETVSVSSSSGGWGGLIITFIVVALLAWFLLYSLNPTAVQTTNAAGNATGTVDPIKVFVAALFIALIVVLLLWAFREKM